MGTIADKIAAAFRSKEAIKEAIENKGVTVGDAPFGDYAAKIEEISSGEETRFGLSIVDVLPNLSNGVVEFRSQPKNIGGFDFSDVVEVKPYAFRNSFRQLNFTLDEINFSNLETVGEGAFYYTFYGTTAEGSSPVLNMGSLENINVPYAFYHTFEETLLSDIDISSLQTINGVSTMENAFSKNELEEFSAEELEEIRGDSACKEMLKDNAMLESAEFPKLKVINGDNACQSMLENVGYDTNGLTVVDLSALESVDGNNAISSFLAGKTKTTQSFEEWNFSSLKHVGANAITGLITARDVVIKKIRFPKLVDIVASSFGDRTFENGNIEEIHFLWYMKDIVTEMLSYPTKFGATNASLLFDIEAPVITINSGSGQYSASIMGAACQIPAEEEKSAFNITLEADKNLTNIQVKLNAGNNTAEYKLSDGGVWKVTEGSNSWATDYLYAISRTGQLELKVYRTRKSYLVDHPEDITWEDEFPGDDSALKYKAWTDSSNATIYTLSAKPNTSDQCYTEPNEEELGSTVSFTGFSDGKRLLRTADNDGTNYVRSPELDSNEVARPQLSVTIGSQSYTVKSNGKTLTVPAADGKDSFDLLVEKTDNISGAITVEISADVEEKEPEPTLTWDDELPGDSTPFMFCAWDRESNPDFMLSTQYAKPSSVNRVYESGSWTGLSGVSMTDFKVVDGKRAVFIAGSYNGETLSDWFIRNPEKDYNLGGMPEIE